MLKELKLIDSKSRKVSLKDFEIVKVNKKNNALGVGSFATVKLAKHKASQKLYALKIIDLSGKVSSADKQNLKREVLIHRGLRHPNIIKFYKVFEENKIIYIVLEYAKYGNLFYYLHKYKRFTEIEAHKYFSHTVLAIKYLHDRNIVHRDLKPENLLINKNKDVKLCDFGWSTQRQKHETMRTFCGTYEYMSPELLKKKSYNYTVDIWGLGILLYELMHGYSPYRAKKAEQILYNITNKSIKFASHISDDARDLVKSILQYKSENRLSLEGILDHPWMQKYSKLSKLNEQNRNSDKENVSYKERKKSIILKTQKKTKKPKFSRKYSQILYQSKDRTQNVLQSIEDFQNKLDLKDKFKSIQRIEKKDAPKSKRKQFKKTKQFASFVNNYNQKENLSNFATVDNRTKKSKNSSRGRYNSKQPSNKKYFEAVRDKSQGVSHNKYHDQKRNLSHNRFALKRQLSHNRCGEQKEALRSKRDEKRHVSRSKSRNPQKKNTKSYLRRKSKIFDQVSISKDKYQSVPFQRKRHIINKKVQKIKNRNKRDLKDRSKSQIFSSFAQEKKKQKYIKTKDEMKFAENDIQKLYEQFKKQFDKQKSSRSPLRTVSQLKQRKNNYFYKHPTKKKKESKNYKSQGSSYISTKNLKSHRSKIKNLNKENDYNFKQSRQKIKDFSPFRSRKISPIEKITQKLQNLAKKKIQKYQKPKTGNRKNTVSQNYFKIGSSRTNKTDNHVQQKRKQKKHSSKIFEKAQKHNSKIFDKASYKKGFKKKIESIMSVIRKQDRAIYKELTKSINIPMKKVTSQIFSTYADNHTNRKRDVSANTRKKRNNFIKSILDPQEEEMDYPENIKNQYSSDNQNYQKLINIEEMERKSKDFNFGINHCFGDFYKKIEKKQDRTKKSNKRNFNSTCLQEQSLRCNNKSQKKYSQFY